MIFREPFIAALLAVVLALAAASCSGPPDPGPPETAPTGPAPPPEPEPQEAATPAPTPVESPPASPPPTVPVPPTETVAEPVRDPIPPEASPAPPPKEEPPVAPPAPPPAIEDPPAVRCAEEPVSVPAREGLERIGVQKCKICHRLQFRSWEESAHASCEPPLDCESCHGPGSEYQGLKVMKDPVLARAAGLVDPDAAFCQENCHFSGWQDGMLARAHAHKDD